MKDFLKNVLATVVGIIVFFMVMGILGAMSLVGMVAASSATTDVKDNSVLVLNLNGMLEERSETNPLNMLISGNTNTIGLDDMISAINKAKENDKIKGIYIEAGLFSSDSPASSLAIRKALLDFKKSGKWIAAYGDQYTQWVYYLASVADKIWLNPQGMIDWHGMASEHYYLKDLMAKFGVKMQLAKVGSYKSAPEMFTSDHMSEPNREQVSAYINGIWDNVVKEISASRKISADTLNAYADRLITFDDPENYVKYKLVDKLLYTDEIKDEVKKLLKIDADKDINQVSVAQMQNVKEKNSGGDAIAVYYAYGDIVDNLSDNIMGYGSHQIVSNDVCRDLEELAKDDDIKAVVLRVNSGGGSAYASEQIWNAMKKLKAKKPVVVSMGGMAASGGYYISCESNWIVAEPTTLTGSIGIFGMFPDVSELLTNKLGVKFDDVKTNKNATFGTRARPFNDEEMSYLNMYIQRGYQLFRKRVADGRKLSVDAVEQVAQGHVWLGQDALKIKLVDQLGGLDDAVKKAAELAKTDKYHTASYPGKADLFEQLMQKTGEANGNYLDAQLRTVLGSYYEPFMLLKHINEQSAIQARIPFYFNIK
ncbi:MAG: signal peptide peptidase SppA [Prevotella sp.]|nr:signal peptide peptidase SppA [Prevotella sp.]